MRLSAFAVAGLTMALSAEAADVSALQGAGHVSPSLGRRADSTGIVTIMCDTGFYLQGSSDDSDDTSDGLFVFSSATLLVAIPRSLRLVDLWISARSSECI